MVYGFLDPRIRGLRQRSYTLSHLSFFSMFVFLLSVVTGSGLSFVLAGPSYLLLMPSFQGVDLLTRLLGGSTMAYAAAIFIKNTLAVTLIIVLARRTRGISVMIILVINGLIIGAVLTSLAAGGHAVKWLVLGIMTHGVAELAAVFLGSALGLRLLLAGEEGLASRVRETFLLSLKLLLPLLMTAALLEAFVTPKVLDLV